MSARDLVGRSIVVLSFWMCSSLPAAAQGVGAIGGTVSDASGAVLPGATVTLSNPRGSIGGNQETVTDARGAFQFIRLVPGVYIVKADLAGFRSAAQENVVVNADVTARVDLKLEIGALSEGITVKGESPLLDTTSALKQTVLSREVLDSLPNRIDVWGVARVIPSVVLSKVDVGGSESFLQSTATVHGSNNENGFLIDGMDVSNLDGNGTGAVLYLDPYAFQENNCLVAHHFPFSSRLLGWRGPNTPPVKSKTLEPGFISAADGPHGMLEQGFQGTLLVAWQCAAWGPPTTRRICVPSCWPPFRPWRSRPIPTSCPARTS